MRLRGNQCGQARREGAGGHFAPGPQGPSDVIENDVISRLLQMERCSFAYKKREKSDKKYYTRFT